MIVAEVIAAVAARCDRLQRELVDAAQDASHRSEEAREVAELALRYRESCHTLATLRELAS